MNGSRRHPSFLSTRSASLLRSSLPSRPTPVAIIQSARGFSHFYFPRSCPTEVGLFLILPSSSSRSQISFHAISSLGCMHLRKICVRDMLNLPHHQHLSDISSSLFFLTRFRQGAHSKCHVRVWEIILESRFDARSRKVFFFFFFFFGGGGGGGVE
jgi:hypothetical protein